MAPPTTKLSCEQCRQRKVKCDKTLPCGPCQKTKLECTAVQHKRQRRPRKDALNNRILRLEDMVRQLEATASSPKQEPGSGLPVARTTHEDPTINAKRFVAPDFWTGLAAEVTGLRDVLEESSDDEGESPESQNTASDASPGQSLHSNAVLFTNLSEGTPSQDLQPPSQELRDKLLSIFKFRVDAIFMVGHWPTMLAAVTEKYSYPSRPVSLSFEALEYAIYFAAMCTLSEAESMQALGQDKESLNKRFQVAAEAAFSRADLITSRDHVVLQAFVIYLVGLRTRTNRSTTWALVALAIRLANGQGIPTVEDPRSSLLDKEAKRRVWYCIGLLDIQTSLDRGSVPLLRPEEFQRPPAYVNDAELTGLPTTSGGFTDMSPSLVTHLAMVSYRRLGYDFTSRGSQSRDQLQTWNDRLGVLTRFENEMQERVVRYCDDSDPLQFNAKMTASHIAASVRLLLYRPMHRTPQESRPPPDEFDVLIAATGVVERSLFKNRPPILNPWGWFIWVPWYALAVVLAEICTQPDHPSINRAWTAAESAFEQYSQQIADAYTGMLWRPIVKLMKKTRMVLHNRYKTADILTGHAFENAPTQTTTTLRSTIKPEESPREFLQDGGVPDMDQNLFAGPIEDKDLVAALDSLGHFTDPSPWMDWDLFLDDVNCDNWIT
ncbi:uncharacterized protein BDZ99DRAFT_471927 [Mytilinidion resinicola]|uniref:Zn(2)-C6 fungal-type domain-containing protein n=1 Tax=Mytilinidion resinicola TaxID=574789 RepID=A0A6A6Z134_9PEZI|nr:uncharacterized protein BDZ99DRAFT_471927 [Mytilinidion resinicola]KAF2814508.1 hypothetical protein BDZ99DRAFT_471927 [Mytilinidion resinicola]